MGKAPFLLPTSQVWNCAGSAVLWPLLPGSRSAPLPSRFLLCGRQTDGSSGVTSISSPQRSRVAR